MAEYDLTVLSILRDSTPYLDRYAASTSTPSGSKATAATTPRRGCGR